MGAEINRGKKYRNLCIEQLFGSDLKPWTTLTMYLTKQKTELSTSYLNKDKSDKLKSRSEFRRRKIKWHAHARKNY